MPEFGGLHQAAIEADMAKRQVDFSGAGHLDATQRQAKDFQVRLEAGMAEGVLSFRLELVYGHAWSAGPRPPEGEFRFDPALISRRRHD